MKRKLNSNAGETLIETLCATVVFTLCMLMLSQSIVAAAKVNRKAEDAGKPLQITLKTSPTPQATTVSVGDKSVDVTMYKTADGYQYYAIPTPSPTPEP